MDSTCCGVVTIGCQNRRHPNLPRDERGRMTALKGTNAAPTSGSIRLVLRELGMARRVEKPRVTEFGYYSSESRPTREARRAGHRGKPGRCLESSTGRYPNWRTPKLDEDSPATDTGTGERRAWKPASGVRRRAGGKGLVTVPRLRPILLHV
jgi:hypothetical protein